MSSCSMSSPVATVTRNEPATLHFTPGSLKQLLKLNPDIPDFELVCVSTILEALCKKHGGEGISYFKTVPDKLTQSLFYIGPEYSEKQVIALTGGLKCDVPCWIPYSSLVQPHGGRNYHLMVEKNMGCFFLTADLFSNMRGNNTIPEPPVTISGLNFSCMCRIIAPLTHVHPQALKHIFNCKKQNQAQP